MVPKTQLLQTKERQINNAGDHAERPAFLIVAAGGTPLRALNTFSARYRADANPFDKFVLYVDTDPLNCPLSDDVLHIGISADQAAAIKGDPACYGRVCEALVRHYPEFLDPESCRHGSRTVRMVTQAAVEVYLPQIIAALNRAIRTLYRRSGGKQVVVILTSSTGGGCGSAIVCILAKLLSDLGFRSLVTEGFDLHVLARPIALVCEPFAFALDNKKSQADKILANAGAFRIETAFLEQQGALQYVFHCGLANDGGAVLDTAEALGKALGASLYALCRDYGYLKSRWVDTVDSNRHVPYRGRDIPEYLYPPSDHPPYAAKVNGVARLYPFSVCNDRLMTRFRKDNGNGQSSNH